ncbi:hypothetical protein AB4275_19230 [Vibrio cyclitrophicus]
MSNFTKPYIGVFKQFSSYWTKYGGLKAIAFSPYAHISFIITMLSSGIWFDATVSWYDKPIGVLPNVIGFSLGGYAIWLALGDDKFRAAISIPKADSASPFAVVNATFVHFISLQIFALVWALVASSKPIYNSPLIIQHWLLEIAPSLMEFSIILRHAGAFIGYFLFIYAILSALAATMAIFKISGWLELYEIGKVDKAKQKSEHPPKDTTH